MKKREFIYAYVAQAYKNDIEGYAHVCRLSRMTRNHSEHIVALCHDLVEDSYATFDDLKEWGLTKEELEAVDFLTRLKNQTYSEYIERIIQAWEGNELGGKLAAIVKYYDLFDHCHPSQMNKEHASKIPRYMDAIDRLVYVAGQQNE